MPMQACQQNGCFCKEDQAIGKKCICVSLSTGKYLYECSASLNEPSLQLDSFPGTTCPTSTSFHVTKCKDQCKVDGPNCLKCLESTASQNCIISIPVRIFFT